MAKSKRPRTLAEVMRDAIAAKGLSAYAVAKGSGVSQPVVHRFVTGERDLTLATADKLCRFLGLSLVLLDSPEST